MSDDKKRDPGEALQTMWKTGPLYAEAKGLRVYMEEFRKTLKAQLMQKHADKAVTFQEREAYAAPEYAVHIKGLQAAVEHEEFLRWRLVTAQTSIEVWRSQEASNRNMDRSTT